MPGPAVRSPTRRVRSAMPPYNLPVCKALSERRYTPYFGAYRLSAAGTGRQCLPEIATGAKRPRNDNSGAGTILTPSRSYRKCSAGPGCPLPAGRRGAAPERFFLQNTRWGLTFCPLRSKLWLEITNRKRENAWRNKASGTATRGGIRTSCARIRRPMRSCSSGSVRPSVTAPCWSWQQGRA